MQEFYGLIPGSAPLPGKEGYFTFPCDAQMQVGFQFGGQNYMMNVNDFISDKSGNTCLGALTGVDNVDDNHEELVFVIGALFMKNVVTVYDLGAPAVGFGRLKNINAQFGEYSIVPLSQLTALGTGPYASLSPTLTVPPGFKQLYIANDSLYDIEPDGARSDGSSWDGCS